MQIIKRKMSNWVEKKVDGIYHLYSNGLTVDIPFGKEDDKIYCMNIAAILSAELGVAILCIIVLDTHFHMLVRDDSGKIELYVSKLRVLLVTYFARRGRKESIGKGLFLSCDELETETSVKTHFCYVYRNCLDCYNRLPSEYEWGSGNIYFSEMRETPVCHRVGDMTDREKREVFHTHKYVPENWLVDTNGKILPRSYVDYNAVEQLFVSPRAYIAFMFVKKEDEQQMKLTFEKKYREMRTIQELREKAREISKNIMNKSLRSLDFDGKIKIASMMVRNGISGKTASLAKAVYLAPEDLKRLV